MKELDGTTTLTVRDTTDRRRRRRYDSTRRREQAAATRARILGAGSELVHQSAVRDWQGLTVRAVADRAGVSERTVYRHFANERTLRDAVMHRLEEEAGIDLSALRLGGIAGVVRRTFEHLSAYPIPLRAPLDDTLQETDRRRRSALLEALAPYAATWDDAERELVAALFDVLWSNASYERLVADWHIEPTTAAAGSAWVAKLVAGAVEEGSRPLRHPEGEESLRRQSTTGETAGRARSPR
jgi:AcrR family transcriptional regulator